MTYQCPNCSYTRSWSIRRSKKKCKRCRREFSSNYYPIKQIRSTIIDWERCIHVFLRQRAGLQVSRETGIPHCRTAAMVHWLRVQMIAEVPQRFIGPVELDETYIGGQRKNKRLHIRRIRAKKGHGTEKLPIMGIFDRSSNQVYVEVMPQKLSMNHIRYVMRKQVVPQAVVYTDGYKMYRGLVKEGFTHAYVDHDDGEYVRGKIHTNNIDGFWGILKRKLSCIGGMRRNRLHLFVTEIVWRFNHRNDSLEHQEKLLLQYITEFGGRK